MVHGPSELMGGGVRLRGLVRRGGRHVRRCLVDDRDARSEDVGLGLQARRERVECVPEHLCVPIVLGEQLDRLRLGLPDAAVLKLEGRLVQ